MRIRTLLLSLITIFAEMMLSASSCKKSLAVPRQPLTIDLKANTSIRSLKALHQPGKVDQIIYDAVIGGIVIANDSSGNFHKEIVIQDTTGGLVILLNGYDLYLDYPVGSKIFIRVKGLYLGDYNGLIQLGDSTGAKPAVAAIASKLFDKYIFIGLINNPVVPRSVNISQLTTGMLDTLQSTLIQLKGFQFRDIDTSKYYADTINYASSNFTLQNCKAKTVLLRNSGYAKFAGLKVPRGNGTITGIYAVYGTSKELFIRDTSDIQFYDIRCENHKNKVLLSQDFAGIAKGTTINIEGWKNITQNGTIKFKGGNYGNNYFATISAYQSSQNNIKTWLISPLVYLDTLLNRILNFKTADGHDNGAALQVFISMDYNGDQNPWAATWTKLPANISSGHSSGYGSLVTSGNIDLSGYTGKAHIAFVYEGNDSSQGIKHTTSFEISNILITEDK